LLRAKFERLYDLVIYIFIFVRLISSVEVEAEAKDSSAVVSYLGLNIFDLIVKMRGFFHFLKKGHV